MTFGAAGESVEEGWRRNHANMAAVHNNIDL